FPVAELPCLCRGRCFFFQAEDGIRDFHVTGVQTCALPISYGASNARRSSRIAMCYLRVPSAVVMASTNAAVSCRPRRDRANWSEIGRASCRERVQNSGGRG